MRIATCLILLASTAARGGSATPAKIAEDVLGAQLPQVPHVKSRRRR